MSQENVEVIRNAFAAFQAGDVSQIIELMADDFVTHRVEPEDIVYRGKEGSFRRLRIGLKTLRTGPQRPRSSSTRATRCWSGSIRQRVEPSAALPWTVTSGSFSLYAKERSFA